MIAQIAQRRFGVDRVIVRVLDPARAAWYAEQGLETICPTQYAIDRVREALGARGRALMYVIICGGGKVGWNLARELIEKGHEVTLVEQDRRRYLIIEEELEHAVQYGDATELWVLERAGIQRADLVIAVTGDDEDNILICQIAKEKYLCERTIARVNNPRNLQHFELLGIQPAVSATDLILRLIEHEVPQYGLVHLLDLPGRAAGDHRDRGHARRARGVEAVADIEMPDGSLIISRAARRRGLRAEGRHGHRGRRRGPARPRPGPRGRRSPSSSRPNGARPG